jgi:hypothetical protein
MILCKNCEYHTREWYNFDSDLCIYLDYTDYCGRYKQIFTEKIYKSPIDGKMKTKRILGEKKECEIANKNFNCKYYEEVEYKKKEIGIIPLIIFIVLLLIISIILIKEV